MCGCLEYEYTEFCVYGDTLGHREKTKTQKQEQFRNGYFTQKQKINFN